MGSIYKNVNADAKRLHPLSNGIPVSYVEAGMRPGDAMRIDLDEMESLIAWHDERENELDGQMDSDSDNIRRMKKYIRLRKSRIARRVNTARKSSADGASVYCMIESVDRNNARCDKCAMKGICLHFPLCSEAGYPDVVYSWI